MFYTDVIFFFLLEGHDPEAPRAEAEPGRTAAQEEARPSAERTEHRPTQRPTQPQQPPAPPLRPGEQPSPGPYTWQEEETPAEETPTCEFNFSLCLTTCVQKSRLGSVQTGTGSLDVFGRFCW